jgi:hypothetical protein
VGCFRTLLPCTHTRTIFINLPLSSVCEHHLIYSRQEPCTPVVAGVRAGIGKNRNVFSNPVTQVSLQEQHSTAHSLPQALTAQRALGPCCFNCAPSLHCYLLVWQWDLDLPVQASRAHEGWVQHVRPVGGHDHLHLWAGEQSETRWWGQGPTIAQQGGAAKQGRRASTNQTCDPDVGTSSYNMQGGSAM